METASSSQSQSFDPTDIGSVLEEMYAMISGPAGPRDWSRQKAVFHPEARMMRTGVGTAGKPWINVMTLEQYRASTAAFFESTGFFEREVDRNIEIFGNVAQVWSAYEARLALEDEIPDRRGVNSIQLYRDEAGAWRIVSMLWDNERRDA